MLKKLIIIVCLSGCGPVGVDEAVPVDYWTVHGIKVSLGYENTPSQKVVEDWTDRAIDFWVERFPEWEPFTDSNLISDG